MLKKSLKESVYIKNQFKGIIEYVNNPLKWSRIRSKFPLNEAENVYNPF